MCDPLAQKTKKKIVCLHQFGDSYSILPRSRLSKTDSAISVTFVFSLMEMMLSIQHCFVVLVSVHSLLVGVICIPNSSTLVTNRVIKTHPSLQQ